MRQNTAGLSASALKILALITMTIDHIGMILLPRLWILRVIGRLAFPIFAYMIAEGARKTRSLSRYLARVLGVGVLCQAVYFFAMHSLYQCILITFSLSLALIALYHRALNSARWLLPAAAATAAVFLFCECLPAMLPDTDFSVDYGFWGVMIPVMASLSAEPFVRLTAVGAGLVMISLGAGWIQWFSLLALIPLALYNGQRGRTLPKYLLYVYYPLHLVVIYGISLFI